MAEIQNLNSNIMSKAKGASALISNETCKTELVANEDFVFCLPPSLNQFIKETVAMPLV